MDKLIQTKKIVQKEERGKKRGREESMALGTNGQSKGKEQIGIFVYHRKIARMGQVDPNIVEIPHKEAYTVEDPQRRSPSLESPRPPPLLMKEMLHKKTRLWK